MAEKQDQTPLTDKVPQTQSVENKPTDPVKKLPPLHQEIIKESLRRADIQIRI